jgi:hypothetical protein
MHPRFPTSPKVLRVLDPDYIHPVQGTEYSSSLTRCYPNLHDRRTPPNKDSFSRTLGERVDPLLEMQSLTLACVSPAGPLMMAYSPSRCLATLYIDFSCIALARVAEVLYTHRPNLFFKLCIPTAVS